MIAECEEVGEVGEWAEGNGVNPEYARLTRSLLMGIERSRANIRLSALRTLRSLTEGVHEGGSVPLIQGSHQSATWLLTHTSHEYREAPSVSEVDMLAIGQTAQSPYDLTALQGRYETVQTARVIEAEAERLPLTEGEAEAEASGAARPETESTVSPGAEAEPEAEGDDAQGEA